MHWVAPRDIQQSSLRAIKCFTSRIYSCTKQVRLLIYVLQNANIGEDGSRNVCSIKEKSILGDFWQVWWEEDSRLFGMEELFIQGTRYCKDNKSKKNSVDWSHTENDHKSDTVQLEERKTREGYEKLGGVRNIRSIQWL